MLISTLQNDIVKPSIMYLNSLKRTATIGSRYSILKACAADVLDPNISFRMQVSDPDGNYVRDVNGLELKDVSPNQDYNIALSKYGTYYVQYYAEDWSRRKENNIGYGIVVLDFQMPQIVLSGNKQTDGKVNEEIYIPDAKATDNIDGEVNVVKTIACPSGKYERISGTKIVLKERGLYTINYYAYDSSGNFAVYSYQIKVS